MSTIHCDECRELLLAAEPGVLRGELPAAAGWADVGDGKRDEQLREHLRTCPRCASLAAALLAETAALDAALRRLSMEPARSGNREPGAAQARPALQREARTSRRRIARWPALVPLAAAAVLLVLWQPWVAVPRRLPPLAGPQEQVPATPVVNASGAGAVAVLRTNNPSITVVWTF